MNGILDDIGHYTRDHKLWSYCKPIMSNTNE